jgi:hypothetical protein
MTPKVPFDRPVHHHHHNLCLNASPAPVIRKTSATTDSADSNRQSHQNIMQQEGEHQENQKSKRSSKRTMENAEYRKLKAVVPSIRHLRRANKLTIINEAVKYIDKLQADLIKRTALRESADMKSMFTYVQAIQRSLRKLE